MFFLTSCGTLHKYQQSKDHKKRWFKHQEVCGSSKLHSINLVGFVHLDLEWREKQPEVLEFAVTIGGFYGKEVFEPAIVVRLGIMLLTSSIKYYAHGLYKGGGHRRRVEEGH